MEGAVAAPNTAPNFAKESRMIEDLTRLLLAERQDGLLIFGSSRDEGYWMAEHAPALMAVATFHRMQREWRGPNKSRVITMVLGSDIAHDIARRVQGMSFNEIWGTRLAHERMTNEQWNMVKSRKRRPL
jgi:hypothetical protein